MQARQPNLQQNFYDGTSGSAGRLPPPPVGAPGAMFGSDSDDDSAAPAAAAIAADADSIVRFNAFGDDYEDLALASLAGRDAKSQVGLWRHFSFFNHSCLPSAVHYVTGSTMVVRAAQFVPAGSEVTVSYLGREEFAPAGAGIVGGNGRKEGYVPMPLYSYVRAYSTETRVPSSILT